MSRARRHRQEIPSRLVFGRHKADRWQAGPHLVITVPPAGCYNVVQQIHRRSPFVREETRPDVICAVCKKPITREQRPSVQIENGDEMHLECWQEFDKARRDKKTDRP
jgi:hypothetical protein